MRKLSKPLKILYISNSPRIIGGAEKSLLSLIENLDRELVCPLFASVHNDELALLIRRLEVQTFHLREFRKQNPFPFLINAIRLAVFITKERVSAIHANRLPDAFYGILPAKLSRIPLIIHHRDTTPFSLIDRFIVSSASQNVCISSWQKKHLLGNRGVVIHNGIEMDRFNATSEYQRERVETDSKRDEFVVVIALIGRITPIKGQKTFIDAAKYVLQKTPNCRFVIAGEAVTVSDRNYLNCLITKVRDYGLDGQIHFAGYIRDIVSFLRTIDISVVPSDREPFGRVVIESMAMEKPVIASNCGGPLDIITRDTGILVSPNQPGELSHAILMLIENSDLRREMGKKGRELVKKDYTIQGTVEKITKLYLAMFGH